MNDTERSSYENLVRLQTSVYAYAVVTTHGRRTLEQASENVVACLMRIIESAYEAGQRATCGN